MGVYKFFLNQISKTSSKENIFIKANKLVSKKGLKKPEIELILHDTDFYEIVNSYFHKMCVNVYVCACMHTHTHMHTYNV